MASVFLSEIDVFLFTGTCGQCNAPSPGVHTPSFTTLYTSGAPVMLSLYLTPATPVVGQPTNLTALARSGVAPFAPLPNASLYILPSIGEEIVTSGYNYNGITGSDGTFTITVQYNIDGQYYPGASLNYFDNIGASLLNSSFEHGPQSWCLAML